MPERRLENSQPKWSCAAQGLLGLASAALALALRLLIASMAVHGSACPAQRGKVGKRSPRKFRSRRCARHTCRGTLQRV